MRSKSSVNRLPSTGTFLRGPMHLRTAAAVAGSSLQTTALINEVYLRLIDAPKVDWQDRAHFFAISAKLVRQVLVHYARSKNTQKRGGKFRQLLLDQASLFPSRPDANLVELDDALTALAEVDPRKAQVVELRFFGGGESKGSRGSAEDLRRHCVARLGSSQGLALPGNEARSEGNGMTPERWQKVERFHHLACQQDSGEREAFLEKACEGDEILRREVGSFLSSRSEAEGFKEASAVELAARGIAEDRAE